VAVKAALRDAGVGPDAIDLIVAFGSGMPTYDQAESAALRAVFGDAIAHTQIWSSKPYIGTCGAGVGGLDAAIAARAIAEQTIPPRINCTEPIDGLPAGEQGAQPTELNHVLVLGVGMGGQNVALILKKAGG